jgi:phosphotransferase system  glucose/maltose/N-acetylglucosamine-specific IIC component
MTQNNKPEWFEITDADEKPELRKVSKSLPVSAVLVAALILGVGAVTAQTQGVTPLSASNTNAMQAAQPENNPTAQAVSAVKSAVANPTTVAAAVVGTVATSKLANPAISTLPTGGNDDDDDHGRGHDDDDEDEDDDDEEGDDD